MAAFATSIFVLGQLQGTSAAAPANGASFSAHRTGVANFMQWPPAPTVVLGAGPTVT